MDSSIGGVLNLYPCMDCHITLKAEWNILIGKLLALCVVQIILNSCCLRVIIDIIREHCHFRVGRISTILLRIDSRRYRYDIDCNFTQNIVISLIKYFISRLCWSYIQRTLNISSSHLVTGIDFAIRCISHRIIFRSIRTIDNCQSVCFCNSRNNCRNINWRTSRNIYSGTFKTKQLSYRIHTLIVTILSISSYGAGAQQVNTGFCLSLCVGDISNGRISIVYGIIVFRSGRIIRTGYYIKHILAIIYYCAYRRDKQLFDIFCVTISPRTKSILIVCRCVGNRILKRGHR